MAGAPADFSVELRNSWPVAFGVAWDVLQPPPFMGYPTTNNRITEEEDNRVIENDDNRVTEKE